MTPSFTLGSSWVDQYLSGLVLLNALLGQPDNRPTPQPATPQSIIQTLQEIALGQYRPEQGAQTVRPGAPELILQPPVLTPAQTYVVIVLNALTDNGGFVSVETGGIIFEDPAWAVLAAQALAQIPRVGVPLPFHNPDLWRRIGLPLASDNSDLWRRLGRVQEAISADKYSPYDFFGGISGFLPRPATSLVSSQPEFRLMEVTSEQMIALRTRGVQSFGNPIRFYELFQHPPAARKAHE